MSAASICLNRTCRAEAEGTVTTCPACGGRMRTPRRVRIAGGVLLACGVFLAGAMGFLTYYMSPTMMRPGVQVGGTTFNGTADQAHAIFRLFGAIALFGAGSSFYGLWMLFTGRRNIAFMVVVLALAAGILFTCWRAMQVLPS